MKKLNQHRKYTELVKSFYLNVGKTPFTLEDIFIFLLNQSIQDNEEGKMFQSLIIRRKKGEIDHRATQYRLHVYLKMGFKEDVVFVERKNNSGKVTAYHINDGGRKALKALETDKTYRDNLGSSLIKSSPSNDQLKRLGK